MAETDMARPKVTLYWLDQSRSQRMVWLLEECKGLDWDVETYKRQKNMLAPPELKKVHPLGKSPVISIKTAKLPGPMVIAESGLITEYLSEHFAPHLIPKRYPEGKDGEVGGESETWMRYRYYMHYAEGSLMPLLLMGLIVGMIKTGPQPFFVKPITRRISDGIEKGLLSEQYDTHFSFLERQISTSPDGGEYLCGKELTGADILMSFPLILAKSRMSKEKYPKLVAYVERLENHEGNVKAAKKMEEMTGAPLKSAL